MNKHLGSTLNEFLEEEELLIESELVAIKRIVALQIEKAMQEKEISKANMARRMGTSRAALDRLLDPANTSTTLHTLERAARVVGKRLHVGIS